jgi:S-adenosylmethionine decarboxylase
MQQTKRVPSWTNPINTTTSRFTYAGTHVVADFWHGKEIKTEQQLKQLLRGAAKAACSTPLRVCVYTFEPQGITGVILLAESHIAVHTWPEIHYTAVDVFTCGKEARPKAALKFLQDALQPEHVEITEMKRGKK